jgi:hypothetical protein
LSGASAKLGYWTTQEDAKASELRQKGLSFEEISKYLPGRSYSAVSGRVTRQAVQFPKFTAKRGHNAAYVPYTAEDLRRITNWKMKDYKGSAEIAERLGRSKSSIEYTWRFTCSKMLNKEDLDSLRLRGAWSENEVKRLRELSSRRTKRRDIALQFPSKSYHSISSQMDRLGIKNTRES